jgi:hypothetical protein
VTFQWRFGCLCPAKLKRAMSESMSKEGIEVYDLSFMNKNKVNMLTKTAENGES